MKEFYKHVTKLSKRIQRELGAGFKENVLQAELAVEFINSKVAYEKELSLDVLYKKHPVGYIVADFYIPQQKNFGIKEDLIIETKQAALENKIDVNYTESLGFFEEERYSVSSTAALRIYSYLDGWERYLQLLSVVPRPFRDALYHLIAKYLYKWIGRREQCIVPTPELRERFLSERS